MLILSLSLIALAIMFIAKSENAAKNHNIILDAIDEYVKDTEGYREGLILIEAMESFWSTVFRFWDWGYENILPERAFERIKPYIK